MENVEHGKDFVGVILRVISDNVRVSGRWNMKGTT
jgi:hypothetical protein